MREIRHDNLVPFLGACYSPGYSGGLYVVTPLCARGGLDDVLSNEDYRLDNMFVASLITDLAKVKGTY
jgi:guanylate cyclase